MAETRRQQYDRRRENLNLICQRCRKYSTPTVDRCNDCATGRKLRMLEVEFSDVTGWKHSYWEKS